MTKDDSTPIADENQPTQAPVDAPSEAKPDVPMVDLDLTTIVKNKKTVRMPDGKVIEIEPPDLGALFEVAKLGGDMKAVQGNLSDLSEEQAVEVYDKLKAAFKKLIPQLADYNLNYEQTFALLDLIIKISMPEDLAELEKRGIKLDADQKKILRDYSKASPSS